MKTKRTRGSGEHYNNVLRDIFEEVGGYIKTTLKNEVA